MTSKKQPDPPAYEAPFVSYYTLRDPAEEPDVIHPAIVPPVDPAAAETPKEN